MRFYHVLFFSKGEFHTNGLEDVLPNQTYYLQFSMGFFSIDFISYSETISVDNY